MKVARTVWGGGKDGDNFKILPITIKSLFKCVSMYNLEKHRFVAYATNAIKNNMGDLIKRIKIFNNISLYYKSQPLKI